MQAPSWEHAHTALTFDELVVVSVIPSIRDSFVRNGNHSEHKWPGPQVHRIGTDKGRGHQKAEASIPFHLSLLLITWAYESRMQ